MKIRKILSTITVLTLCLNLIGQDINESKASNQVGTLPGSVSVNPNGFATYNIPIKALPGRAGMTPSVSLVYNSMSGNGSVGIGWNISGLQSISRGGTDLYFETEIDGIDFDGNDKFYLNGQRLIEISPDEYKTENDMHLKIISNGIAGNGPESFTVIDKDGTQLQFGHTIDSRIEASGREDVMFWRLNRIIDVRGNYIDYLYDESSHLGLISSIKYTGNTNTGETTFNSIDFVYKSREDNNTFFMYGSSIQQNKLLDRIETRFMGKLENTYQLTYSYEHLGDDSGLYPKLISAQLIFKNGSKMNATVFNWGKELESFNFDWTKLNIDGFRSELTTGDFDGNGKTDIIAAYYYLENDDNVIDKIYVYYSNDDGTSFEKVDDYWLNYYNLNDNVDVLVPGDYNGDGKTDVAFIILSGHLAKSYRFLLSFDDGFHSVFWNRFDNHDKNNDFIATDINGNGIKELTLLSYDNVTKDKGIFKNYIKTIEIEKGNEYGYIENHLTKYYGEDGYFYLHNQPNNLLHIIKGDFSGDGKTNLLQNSATGITNILYFNNNTGRFYNHNERNMEYPSQKINICLPADFNGDGITDLFSSQAGTGPFNITIFNGNSNWISMDDPIEVPSGNQNTTYVDFKYQIGDYNGDGKSDIFQLYHEYYDKDIHDTIPAKFVQNHWQVYYSNGSSFKSEHFTNTAHTTFTEKLYVYDDLNGDGKNDLLMPETDRVIFFHKNEKSNKIQSFINGLGHQTVLKYDYLTDNSIYEKGSESKYPVIDIQPSYSVVSNKRIDNGIGGWIETDYLYKKARIHLLGKGFLGFEQFITRNTTLNTINELDFTLIDKDTEKNPKYYFSYPSENRLYSTTTNDRDLDQKDKLLRKTTSTLELIINSSNNYIYTPITILNVVSKWDNNNENSHLSTVATFQEIEDIDPYGNSTKLTSKVFNTNNINSSPIKTNEIITNYIYDLQNHILNRPIKIINTTLTPENPKDVAITKYIYYYPRETTSTGVECWPLLKIKETIPNGDSDYKNTITLEYDEYSNITKKTVSALDLEGEAPYKTINRISEFEYSNANNYFSRFLTKYILVDKTNYITTYTYFAENGQVKTITDPTRLATSFIYDIFGRLRLTEFPDGNFQNSHLYWVTAEHTDAPNNAVYYTWTQNSGSSVKRVFYDKLNRPLRTATEGLTSSEVIFIDQKYNERGLTSKVSEPFYSTNPPDDNDHSKWTNTTYDRLGRVYLIETPVNSYTKTYDGLITKVIDNYTKIEKVTEINSLGQSIRVSDPTGDILYKYYSNGQLKSTKALGMLTSYQYDPLGNASIVNEANHGTYSYKYGAWGELINQIDPKENTTNIEYDGLGRIKKKTINSDITEYEYYETPEENGFGQLQKISGSNGIEISYDYDNYNRPFAETKLIEGTSYTSTVEYDSYGRMKSFEYPTGYKIDYFYTQETGIFYKLEDHQTGDMLYQTSEINQRGQLLNYELGNGLITSKEYNPISGLIESIKTTNVQNLSYKWNNSTGNLQSRSNNLGTSLTETFTYDKILQSRLASWQVGQGELYEINYSNNGNISSKSDVNRIKYGQYNYDSHNKPNAVSGILQPKSEYVNNNGRQDVEYNSFNKIKHISQEKDGKLYEIAFTYGPENMRYKTVLYEDSQILKTKYFIFNNFEIEYDTQGNKRELHYISASDGVFAINERKSTSHGTEQQKLFFIHKDHLGSYETITDESGVVVEKFSFDAWGRRRNADTWNHDENPKQFLFDRGFTQHEHLDLFGLINMNGRVYDPWLGSFLSPDPKLQSPQNSQNYNRFSYALNNPLKYIDPSGYLYENQGEKGNSPYYYSGSLGYRYGNSTNTRGGYISILPGSGGHWTDRSREEYGSYMLMSSRQFDSFYGDGASRHAAQLIETPALFAMWRDGNISVTQVTDEGYWVDSYQINNFSFTTGDGSFPMREFETISKWVPFENSDDYIVSTEDDISGEPELNGTTKVLTEKPFLVKRNIRGKTYTKIKTPGNTNYTLNFDIYGDLESITVTIPTGKYTFGIYNSKIVFGGPGVGLSVGMDENNYLLDISVPLKESATSGVTLYLDKKTTDQVIRVGFAAASVFQPELKLIPAL